MNTRQFRRLIRRWSELSYFISERKWINMKSRRMRMYKRFANKVRRRFDKQFVLEQLEET